MDHMLCTHLLHLFQKVKVLVIIVFQHTLWREVTGWKSKNIPKNWPVKIKVMSLTVNYDLHYKDHVVPHIYPLTPIVVVLKKIL